MCPVFPLNVNVIFCFELFNSILKYIHLFCCLLCWADEFLKEYEKVEVCLGNVKVKYFSVLKTFKLKYLIRTPPLPQFSVYLLQRFSPYDRVEY